MAEEVKIIRGTVTRLFHQSPGFCAGKLLPNRSDVTRGGEISFAGKVWVSEEEYVVLKGKWADHPKFGRQFAVEQRVHEDGIDVQGLAGWLAVHGKARGIGIRTAERIANEFGENFSGILNDNPEQIAIFAQVPMEVVQELAKDFAEYDELNRIGTKLAAYELTAHQIHALYQKFKGSIIPLLESNPYLLVGEVPGLGFKRVDEIAKKMGVPEAHPGRFDAALLHCVWQEKDDGSTCVEHGNLLGTAVEILDYRKEDADSLLGESVERLIEKNRRLVEIPDNERKFYSLPHLHRFESAVMEFLFGASRPNPHWSEEVDHLAAPFIDPDDDTLAEKLDESQARALKMALRSRACLISGGAGVGKTFLIRTITDIYCRDNLRVLLCAPTGKAARRIEEVTGHAASTIHRMLRYRPPEGFPEFILEADVVIVDEASMVDIELAYYLFRAIGENTAVVLVGDHHQLPPVGAGALLRDCISQELLPLSILNQCHRQAGTLKKNCSAILHGEVHPTATGDDSLPWVVNRRLDLSQSVLDYVENLFLRGLSDKLGVDPLKDVQFLTPQHGGPLGTRSLNILLQRLHQQLRGVTVDPVDPDSRPKLYPGDKVIQTKNNYKLDIMNGHQGCVVNLNPLVVDFGDGRVVGIPNDCKGEIELAYALTVHKVQGSQFPVVVFVCHKQHSFMLNRSLLYTAVTRAMRSCIVVGDDAGVSKAAKTLAVNKRRTLLPILARSN